MVSVPLSDNGENVGGGRRGLRQRPNQEPNFEALPDSIPPQNLEAEEAVLGGILLDPDAIGRVADVLQPEAFYMNAHREIFRTALMLHGQGKPTDLTAMSAWLADTGSLEKVGGNRRTGGAGGTGSLNRLDRTGGAPGDGQVPAPPVDPLRE